MSVRVVNWLLMPGTVGTTIAFGRSDRLAGAYGTAVATTMLLTTVLLFRAMRDRWRWPLAAACAVAGFFLVVDSSFFVANLWKIAEGGWLPLTFAAILFCVMVTWRTGVDAIKATLAGSAESGEQFLSELKKGRIPPVDGTTGFLTRSTQKGSKLIMDHARVVRGLPRHAIALRRVVVSTPPRLRP